MNLRLGAQRQYDIIYSLRDMVVALYFISSDVFTYSLLHDVMRIAVVVFHIFMLIFSDTKQPMGIQLIWQTMFLMYFSFHTLFGFSMMSSTSINQITRCFVLMILLNTLICMMQKEDGLNKFINIYTFTVIVKTMFICFLQYDALGSARVGTISFYIPVLGVIEYNANTFGMSCALCILLQLYMLCGRKKAPWRFAVMVLCTVMVLMTGSRKALLLIVAFIFIFIFFNYPRHRIMSMVVLGLFIAMFLFLILNVESLYNVIGYRVMDLIQNLGGGDLEESSAISRSKMIQSGLTWLKLRPFTGYGLDCFRHLSGSYGTYSHNNFVELMVSGGIQTLFIYYWFYIYLIIKTLMYYKYQEKRRLRALSLCPILILPVLEYGWITYPSGLVMVFFALSCSLLATVRNENRIKKQRVW